MRKHGFDTGSAVRVGSGASADVYRIRHENGKEYAIKIFDTLELDAANRSSLLNEARLLAALPHPHIVAFKDTFLTRDRQFVCLAMELLTGGTLAELIKHQAAVRQYLPEPLVWRYFLQLATAVAHMHAAGVVHRDLKPTNCMFSDTTHSQLKVLDLGLARRLVLDHTLSQAGTPAYAAPEVYNRQPMSFPVDVWSLGCILHELCALQPAFDGISVRRLRGQVLLGTTNELPRQYGSELRQLVAAMMQQDPAQRITMPQLLAHPDVAPRLAQLQAQGLVGVAAAQSSGSAQVVQEPAPTAPCCQATRGASSLFDPGTLERLLELLPPPRHSSAAEEVSGSCLHTLDAQLSAWYASGPAAALPAAQQPEQRPLCHQALASQQAAVLGALHLPSGLTDIAKKQPAGASGQQTIVIHVDAFGSSSSPFGNMRGNGGGNGSSAVPAPAVQPAPLPAAHPTAGESDCKRQPSCSLPDHTTAEPVQPQVPAVLAQLHPRFRKMAEEALKLEAAGMCRPRPTCTQRASPSGSPAQAPGSPQPASGRPRSTAGTAGTPRTRPPAPRYCLFDARAMEARIEEAKRCGGGAAAMAAAVRACLADQDAAFLRHITERVSSVMSTPRASPRIRAAAATSVEGSVAGLLADELRMERRLPGCPPQPGTLGHSSPLGRPSAPQQLEQAAGVRDPDSMVAVLQQPQPTQTQPQLQPQQCSVLEQEQHSVEEQKPRKLLRRWSFRNLLFRRRTAH